MLIAYYDVYWHLSIEFASSLEHELDEIWFMQHISMSESFTLLYYILYHNCIPNNKF